MATDDLFAHLGSPDEDDPGDSRPSRAPAPPEFPATPSARRPVDQPLADRLRPSTLKDYHGQEHLLGPGGPLRRLIEADRVPSMILWGPPGSGKTTLALLIARATASDFVALSAVSAAIKDIRSVVDTAKLNRQHARRTILFLDEIHRFNKAQQDGLLPHAESGLVTLIGATTENPSFSVIAPLLSRCRVFTLKALETGHLEAMLARGLAELSRAAGAELVLEDAARSAIIRLADGDGRRALGMLETVGDVARAAAGEGAAQVVLDEAIVRDVAQRHYIHDRAGEEHYNLISALHKTLRSNDPHGAIYWAERMMAAGEDPRFILRRLVRAASEDVGLADPDALPRVLACLRAHEALGSPEGDIHVTQAAAYLACAPKSNALYRAHKEARAAAADLGSLPVPLHLRNAPTRLMKDLGFSQGYTYDPEAEGGFAPKQGLPDELDGTRFYRPTDQGAEKRIGERLAAWDEARDAERARRR